MQSLRIAFRNVTRQWRRSLPLASAVGFGFFVFTVVTAFTNGLLDSVETNVASLTGGHIYVSGSELDPLGRELNVIRDPSIVDAAVEAAGPAVAARQRRSSAPVSLIAGSRETRQLVLGVDPGHQEGFLDGLTFSDGDPASFLGDPNGLLLPADTIEALGIDVGERVIVKATTIRGQLNIADFVVRGSIVGQQAIGIDFGYAHIDALDALLDVAPGEVQAMTVLLADLGELDATTDRLEEELSAYASVTRASDEADDMPAMQRAMRGGLGMVAVDEAWEGTRYQITTVDDLLGGMRDLVDIMNYTAAAIFAVVVAIILVGVMNAYRMVMIERTPEIGAMRAMGVQRAGIRNIFLAEAFFVAAFGAVAGLLLALVAMGAAGLIDLGSSSLSFFLQQGHLHFSLVPLDTVLTTLLISVMSVAAVLLPARAAARIEPAEALRSVG